MRSCRGGSRPTPSPSPSSSSPPARNHCDCVHRYIRGSGQSRHLPSSSWIDSLPSLQYINPRPAFVASPLSSAPPFNLQASPFVLPAPFPVDNNPSRQADDHNSGPLQKTGTTAGKCEVGEGAPQRIPDPAPEDSNSGQLQNTRTTAGECVAVDDASQAVPDLDLDDKEGWWCRIEEESPSGDYRI